MMTPAEIIEANIQHQKEQIDQFALQYVRATKDADEAQRKMTMLQENVDDLERGLRKLRS